MFCSEFGPNQVLISWIIYNFFSQKSSIIDVWLSPKYASDIHLKLSKIFYGEDGEMTETKLNSYLLIFELVVYEEWNFSCILHLLYHLKKQEVIAAHFNVMFINILGLCIPADFGTKIWRLLSFVLYLLWSLCRSTRPEVLCKKSVVRNFPKLTGKHLCQSLQFY